MTQPGTRPIRDKIGADIESQTKGGRDGELSTYSCPDCGGVLWQATEEGLLEFRCHLGHDFTGDRLAVAKSQALRQAVVEAVRTLREKSMLLRQLGALANPASRATADLIEQADQDEEHARLLQTRLLGEESPGNSADPTEHLLRQVAREWPRTPDD
jgi:two-component system chemotaxis response regulator CheB